jgi:hypothetical protein
MNGDEPEPATAAGDEPQLAGAAGDAPQLAGAAGDDVSGGTSVSGVGGEELRHHDADAGLAPVSERAARIGWGRTAEVSPDQPVAGNDGTGQSEKDPQGGAGDVAG